MKNDWIDEQSARYEEARLRKLAEHLGLTYEEIKQADPKFDEQETNDGMQVGWFVELSAETPKAILDKLNGKRDFTFGLHSFDTADMEDSEEDMDLGGVFVDLPSDFVKRTAEELRKQKKEGETGSEG